MVKLNSICRFINLKEFLFPRFIALLNASHCGIIIYSLGECTGMLPCIISLIAGYLRHLRLFFLSFFIKIMR